MHTARATRRQGPLTALEGSAPALAIGDVAVRNLRLTTDGIARHLGDAQAAFMPWTRVRSVIVQPPTTRWPHPAIGDSIGPILEGLLGGGVLTEGERTPTFPVVIETIDGDRIEWAATQHYLSGYRRADARAATRLAEYLVAHPDARVLLAQPAELLDRIALLLRRPPIAE